MKSTGVTRKIDSLGRFVIPKELREKMELPQGTPVEIYVDGNRIILKKDLLACCFCESEEDLLIFKEQKVCRRCAAELGKICQERKPAKKATR